MRITRLRCDGRKDPLGVEKDRLRFSFTAEAEPAEELSYCIIVTDAADRQLWRSEYRPLPSGLVRVCFTGAAPASGLLCFWQVWTSGEDSAAGPASERASFQVGYGSEHWWEDHWITASKQLQSLPLLTRDFEVSSALSEALLIISAPGYHRTTLDGMDVGDDLLGPGQTDYEQRVFYQIYRLTDRLGPGSHRLQTALGTGWYDQHEIWSPDFSYGRPKMCAALLLTSIDGEQHMILTDENWTASPSGTLHSNIYSGESYDARLSLDAAALSLDPAIRTSCPGGRMEYQYIPPERRISRLEAQLLCSAGDGKRIYDLGRNIAGFVRLRTSAPAAERITLRFAEDLDAEGRLDTGSTGVFATGTEQVDSYISSGEALQEWEPSFCYHGFRYVEASAASGPLDEDFRIIGFQVNTDLSNASSLKIQHPVVDRVWSLAWHSFEGNLHSLLTDCPARERCGWLGDTHLVTETLLYSCGSALLFDKILDDIETTSEGGIPWDVAPGKRRCLQGCPDWILAAILIPWDLYLFTADRSILLRHEALMKRVISFIAGSREAALVTGGRGDWCPPGHMVDHEETPAALQNSLLFAHACEIMYRVSQLLGEKQQGLQYLSWKQESMCACIERYYHEGSGFRSQTADAMAIDLGLLEGSFFDAAAKGLASSCVSSNGDISYRVGAFGAKYLYPALSRIGRDDLVFRLLTHEGYPGYLDIIEQGATTLWENWEKVRIDAPVCEKRSLNHHMHGSFGAWFFAYAAGIQLQQEHPGFSRFTLAPHMDRRFGSVCCTFEAEIGIIESSWRFTGESFLWHIRIPSGAIADLSLPTMDPERVEKDFRCIFDSTTDRPFSLSLRSGEYYLSIKESTRHEQEEPAADPCGSAAL